MNTTVFQEIAHCYMEKGVKVSRSQPMVSDDHNIHYVIERGKEKRVLTEQEFLEDAKKAGCYRAPPRDQGVEYQIAEVKLSSQDYVFVELTSAGGTVPDKVLEDTLHNLQECCAEEGVRGIVVLVWFVSDLGASFYPKNIPEVWDFMRGMSYQTFKGYLDRSIRCTP